jgi:hypothetical protein
MIMIHKTLSNLVYPIDAPLSIPKSKQGDHFDVHLVQAICTYVGGFGLALLTILSFGSRTLPPSRNASRFITWSLSHAAIECTQWVVTGASRIMVLSMKNNRKNMFSWNKSCISILLPFVLHVAYNIQHGIHSFDESNNQLVSTLALLEVEGLYNEHKTAFSCLEFSLAN